MSDAGNVEGGAENLALKNRCIDGGKNDNECHFLSPTAAVASPYWAHLVRRGVNHRCQRARNPDALFYFVALHENRVAAWHWPNYLYGWTDIFDRRDAALADAQIERSQRSKYCRDRSDYRSSSDDGSGYSCRSEHH